MPAKNPDLHGNVPDTCPVVLLLVDVINDMEFPGGDRLAEHALPAARHIADVKAKAREHGVPVVYANDNFGRWRSDFREVVEHCLNDGVRGEPIVRLLAPDKDDYFVLKPKHSAFYGTTLDTLLRYLNTRRLVICGFSGDQCVLFTAADAYVRDLLVSVPADCTASINPRQNRRMLGYMHTTLKADTTPAPALDFAKLIRRATEDHDED
jgi:nicotinamidase-related amidase